jgi:hypothetical protein
MLENTRRRFGAGNTIDLEQPTPPDQPNGNRSYPDEVKSRYFVKEKADRTTFYRDYQGKEPVFRLDRGSGRMTTRTDDIATVRDMMSVGEAQGWKTVKLGGSKAFRREAWIEAAALDIAATGYKPTELDRQEAGRRWKRRDHDKGPASRDDPPQGPTIPPDKPNGPTNGRVVEGNVLSLEIEKATRSTRAVQRDEARVELDQMRLGDDQARGRPGDVARDETRLQRDDARLGADRSNLSDAARSILSTLGKRIDKEMTGLTGGEKERLKDFTAGLLAARELQVGRLQDPGPPPRESARQERTGAAEPQREPYPEPEIPLPRRQRDLDRSL